MSFICFGSQFWKLTLSLLFRHKLLAPEQGLVYRKQTTTVLSHILVREKLPEDGPVAEVCKLRRLNL